jgi:glycogen operon protein
VTESPEAKNQSLGMVFATDEGSFSIYSENASSIKLLIWNEDVTEVSKELDLNCVGTTWTVSDSLIVPGVKYTVRVDGPKSPRNAFNNSLDLIDPYARGVVRKSAREYYNVGISDAFDWEGIEKPNTPLEKTIIYEAHLRGLTRGNSAIPDQLRGTYAALGSPETIAHLKKLGVTAVELLPIQMFISEPRLMNMGLINYWGYNTINFFSPHPRYASEASRNQGPGAIIVELKTAIRELHRNGIEVILDVVYNHTAEGGSGGLTYSFRGIDQSSYYRLDDDGNYQDTTGCGNSLNFSNPKVMQLVMDSLRYWSQEMQIDGFRFDLATTLARDQNNNFDANHPLLKMISEDPDLANSKMIVEPWDVGLGGWQTGNFPDRFSEWNDRFRDDVRKFWLTDISSQRVSGHYPYGVAGLATKLSGSVDVVDGTHGVLGGVNFITAHDGFTLRDLVSYNVKHNQVNGESNRDGANNNNSFNFGFEGESSDLEISELRNRVSRNLLATLLFSSGVPMITAGDERGKSQQGNNNAYCQDSSLSWLNWELRHWQKDLEDTTAFLIRLRQENPVLRPEHFANYEAARSDSDRMRWFNSQGDLMTDENWQDNQSRTLQRLSDHLNPDGSLSSMLLVAHGSEDEVQVMLPALDGVNRYELLWDSKWERPQGGLQVEPSSPIAMAPLSMVLLRVL